jgi:hypothetical protein
VNQYLLAYKIGLSPSPDLVWRWVMTHEHALTYLRSVVLKHGGSLPDDTTVYDWIEESAKLWATHCWPDLSVEPLK